MEPAGRGLLAPCPRPAASTPLRVWISRPASLACQTSPFQSPTTFQNLDPWPVRGTLRWTSAQGPHSMASKADRNTRSSGLNRRNFLQTGIAGGMLATYASPLTASQDTVQRSRAPKVRSFELDEATASGLQESMTKGRTSSRAITEKYIARIRAIDQGGPQLNSIIELNPDALTIAEALDKERKKSGPRGPLHGIPILIKDNIDTADAMATTGGFLALLGARPPADAFLVQQLRKAGAVILGKTNLSEWANIRST